MGLGQDILYGWLGRFRDGLMLYEKVGKTHLPRKA